MSVRVTDYQRDEMPIWHVPEPRPQWFTGRQAVLLFLRERLQAERVTALTQESSEFARGGMGKTVTAREYVQQYRAQYTHIVWLQAYSEFELRAGLVELGEKLGWPERDSARDADLYRAIQMWLSSTNNWLLVLDEVRNPEIAAKVLPAQHAGHVLITSRRSDLNALGVREPVRLRTFSERESREFLLRRTGRDDADQYETDAAIQLAEELGHFPLALELASAHIAANYLRFQDYLDAYRRRERSYVQEEQIETDEYSAEVAVAARLLLDAVEEASPESADLLRFCSGLRPTGIPSEILMDGRAQVEFSEKSVHQSTGSIDESRLQRDRLTEPLMRFGLLRRDTVGRGFLIHRVVQAVVWDSLTLDQQRNGIQRQANIVARLWNDTDSAERAESCREARRGLRERIFPQAMTAAKLVTAWAQATLVAAQLLRDVAEEFLARGRPGDACSWYREAVQALRKLGGERHPDLASVFCRLADIYEAQQEPQRALPRLERALDVLEHTRPSDDSELIAVRLRLARLGAHLGRLSQSAEQWEKIVEHRERTCDSLDSELIAARERLADLYCTLNKPAFAELLVVRQLALLQQDPERHAADLVRTRLLLARVLHNMGRLAEAERLLVPMLERQEGESPADRLQHADVLHRLALVTATSGRNAAAEEWLTPAVAVRKQLLGANDLLLAVTYTDLAEICFAQAKYGQAHELLQKALEIQEQRLAAADPQVVRTRNNLAAVLAAMGAPADAEKLFLADLESKHATLGDEHPHVATTLNNLGVVYGLLGREADEERMFCDALAIREKAFGREHPLVAQSLCQLAGVWMRQGRYVEAEALVQQAAEIRQARLSPEHPDQALAMNGLAEIYLAQEIRGRAEPLLQSALALLEKSLGSNDLQVAAVNANLGEALRLSEQFDLAEVHLKKALTSLDQPNRLSGSLVRCLVALGLWERDRRRFDAAQKTLRRALLIQEQLVGERRVELVGTLRHLAEVALAREQFAQAEPLLQRALNILNGRVRHPEQVACGTLLAGLRIALEDRAGAEQLIDSTLVAAEALLSVPLEPAVLKWLHPLADVCFHLRRFEQASELWDRQLALAEKTFGPQDLELTAPLKGLAKLYHSQARFADAEPLLLRCLAINEKRRDANHPELARAVENLAGLYFLQHRFEEAEPLIQRAIAFKERAFGRRHAKVADALDNYAALLRKTNRPDQADELESRAAGIRLKHEHILGDLF